MFIYGETRKGGGSECGGLDSDTNIGRGECKCLGGGITRTNVNI